MSDSTKPTIETVDIDSIHLDPANLRVHPEANLAAIAASLARFGQQKPIVVDPRGIVRDGNGTLEAARRLGWTGIMIVRSELTGSEATAYAIAANQTALKATWDEVGLAETLRSLQAEDFDLTATGFDVPEVDALLERLAAEHVAAAAPGPEGEPVDDPDAEWQGMPSFEHEDLAPKRKIIMSFASDADAVAFGNLIGQTVHAKTLSLWHPRRENRRHSDKQWSTGAEVSDLCADEGALGEPADDQGA